MSASPKPLDLEAIETRVARAAERALRGDPWDLDQDEQDRAALLAEVKRLRADLDRACKVLAALDGVLEP